MLPGAATMNTAGLRDLARPEFLAAIVENQSPEDRDKSKCGSPGHGESVRMGAVAKVHAALRIRQSLVSVNCRATAPLRASVLRLYERCGGSDLREVISVQRVDQDLPALAEATDRFMVVMERTHNEFFAVLGHDLRTPLSVVLTTATLVAREGDTGAKASARIISSVERMRRLVSDLLDLTRTQTGNRHAHHASPGGSGCHRPDRGCRSFARSTLNAGWSSIAKGISEATGTETASLKVLSNLIGNEPDTESPAGP